MSRLRVAADALRNIQTADELRSRLRQYVQVRVVSVCLSCRLLVCLCIRLFVCPSISIYTSTYTQVLGGGVNKVRVAIASDLQQLRAERDRLTAAAAALVVGRASPAAAIVAAAAAAGWWWWWCRRRKVV